MKQVSPGIRRATRWVLPALLVVLLAGCEATRYNTEGMRLIDSGQVRAGLESLRKANDLDPSNARYRMDFLSQRALVTQRLNDKADEARNSGRLDEAQRLYIDVTTYEHDNERARRGLAAVEEARRTDQYLTQADKAFKAGQYDVASELIKRVLREAPQHAAARALQREINDKVDADRMAREKQLSSQAVFKRPVTLQFRDANLRMVFEALSRTANLNIILDREVKNDLRTTIYVKDASVEDTIDIILLQNQLEKRVLNNNTIFVYPATPAKQKEYAELKVRSFQLSNVDAQYMANIIKTMLKTKDVVTDQRTNTLIMRDTPEAIAVAEKLVAAQDIADPEVMLEVEVLEVSTGRLQNLGIDWPSSISFTVPPDSSGGSTRTLGGLRNVTSNSLLVSTISAGVNLQLQDTDARVLASPRIRARNKEKAKILIGDKVPVITNTVTPVQTGGSVVTGSVQYLDVGIKLEVEPQVYTDDDVGIKINLEVSNIAKEIQGPSGSLAYQIGTRNASTSVRLHDGETQVMGGLINDQDRSSASKIPGLGQLPVLGRLFSNHSDNGTKSEIILSITPHIIRPQGVADVYVRDVWSGTESGVRERPLRLDPIGTARSTSSIGPAAAPLAAPTTPGVINKATQGSTIGVPGRPGFVPGTAAPAPELAAPSAAPPPASNPAAPAPPSNGATGSASPSNFNGTPRPQRNNGPVPPSIRPGRGLVPAAPSAPPGTTPPPPPPSTDPDLSMHKPLSLAAFSRVLA